MGPNSVLGNDDVVTFTRLSDIYCIKTEKLALTRNVVVSNWSRIMPLFDFSTLRHVVELLFSCCCVVESAKESEISYFNGKERQCKKDMILSIRHW
jgi:hypothetical protein